MKKKIKQVIIFLLISSIILLSIAVFFARFYTSLISYKSSQYLILYPFYNRFILPISILALLVTIILITKSKYITSLVSGFGSIAVITGSIIVSAIVDSNLVYFKEFSIGFYLSIVAILMLISTYSILIANLSQSDLPRWWKTYREKILKKRTKNNEAICPEGVDKDSGLTTRRKYKYSMEIAKTIIGIGIILWLIQESVTFFDYWKNPIDFFNDFFLIMMIADWIGIFTLLVFFVSQYMEKWSEFLSFLAQIVLYLYGLVAISGHVMFYYYIPVIVGVSSVMIIFLLVLHLIYKIKKRSQDGFVLQVQALVAVIVAIFDLFLGHAARYSILEEGLGEGIRLGLTFLPVQLEFVLTMAFAMYFLLKSSLAEKTRKTVLIILNSIGLIGLMAGYMLWGDWYLPVKFAGSVVILLGVIFYLILSLISLKILDKMEEHHTSKC